VTTIDQIVAVLDQIVALLSVHGHQDRAAFLANEAALLRSPIVTEADVRASLQRLHGIVPGMGGLMDLPLTGASPGDRQQARNALDELGDQLYELTR
jgi:hypothetical protein